MVIQYLSAKLGIVTDLNYPEVVRAKYHRAFTFGMWVQAEIMAMSTDIAECLGAAIGLNLLFGVPLFVAGLMTGGSRSGSSHSRCWASGSSSSRSARCSGSSSPASCTRRSGSDRPCTNRCGLIPGLQGGDTELYIAVGIVGATVMPHVIYLHSALTKGRMATRNDARKSACCASSASTSTSPSA